ncbi:MAG: hypothetical protein E3J25_08840 [Anaerolineales bacterium]|nr:MAG: hypothetical protein E3J25_08840 [Anaerolineales bacterium]
MNWRKTYHTLQRAGIRRLVLIVVITSVAALAAGLLAARPWQERLPDCPVVVRPGESIQAAIDAAETGDVICLAEGLWTENLVIDKPLTLVGQGEGMTVINPELRLRAIVLVPGQGAEPIEVRLEGLTMEGSGGGSGVTLGGLAAVEVKDCTISGRITGIEVADSARLTLNGCTVYDSRQRAVVLSGSARASISRSSISGNRGPGVWVYGSAEVEFDDCDISGNGGHGLLLQDEARATLSECAVSGNRGHGLWLTGQSVAHLLRSEVSDNSDQGIKADDGGRVEVTGTRVLSNWNGIEVRHGARVTLTDADVSKNRWDGIRVRDSARVAVSGSVISANRRGVAFLGNSGAEISDCLIEGNSVYGVFSWSTGEVIGAGNSFLDNGVDLGGDLPGTLRLPLREAVEAAITWPDERYASLQEAVDALLPGGTLLLEPGTHTAGLTIGKKLSIEAREEGATLTATRHSLPVLSLVGGAELRLAGAAISDGSVGIVVSSAGRLVLVGCTISRNAQGINLSSSSSAEIADCSIEGNEMDGVFIGGAAQAAITRCVISDHGEYGIAVADSARVTITDTVVTGSGRDGGVVLWGSPQAILEGNTIVDNRGSGVVLFMRPCFLASPRVFQGRISGSNNFFGVNQGGAVCPPELGFLSTAEGGELDLRS